MYEEAKVNGTLQQLEDPGVADSIFRKLPSKEQAVCQAVMTARPMDNFAEKPRWLWKFKVYPGCGSLSARGHSGRAPRRQT